MPQHSTSFLVATLFLTAGCSADSSKPETTADTTEGDDTADGQSIDTGSSPEDTGQAEADTGDTTDTGDTGDTGEDPVEPFIPNWPDGTDPFADAVSAFEPGPDAGFGSDDFPDIVLGSPEGRGVSSGSLHVLSLGELGSITLEMTDLEIIDGPGPDLIVFENAFTAWIETGRVEASVDGIEWFEWACEAENAADDFPGCAGVSGVYATSELEVDPTDPLVAGGDAFDLADIGLSSARFIRITDSGFNAMAYGGETGGFDLDAIAAANWAVLTAE